jgi:hypothetical protein
MKSHSFHSGHNKKKEDSKKIQRLVTNAMLEKKN